MKVRKKVNEVEGWVKVLKEEKLKDSVKKRVDLVQKRLNTGTFNPKQMQAALKEINDLQDQLED